MRGSRSGFTMIEMAVVLAIVGIIAGGILSGQKLLQSSRVRGIITQAASYSLAIQGFAAQYGELPGDFSQATRVWGRADGGTDLNSNCASPNSNPSSGAPTCNGDGDGFIQVGNSAGVGESYRAWQQMAAAGFIVGKFNGIPGAGGANHSIVGTNVPPGPLTNTAFAIGSFGLLVGDTNLFDADYNNTLFFGASVTNSWPVGEALTPTEAYQLDSKADDGRPAYGAILASKATQVPNCVSTSVATTASYKRSFATAACYLYFLQTFKRTNPL